MECSCIHDNGKCTRTADFRIVIDPTTAENDWCKECVADIPETQITRLEILGEL